MNLKVLRSNRSTYQSFEYSMPTLNDDGTWEPGAWHSANGDIVLCRNGLHYCDEDQLWQYWAVSDMAVYEWLALASIVAQAVAVYFLFQPDAHAWLTGGDRSEPED